MAGRSGALMRHAYACFGEGEAVCVLYTYIYNLEHLYVCMCVCVYARVKRDIRWMMSGLCGERGAGFVLPFVSYSRSRAPQKSNSLSLRCSDPRFLGG